MENDACFSYFNSDEFIHDLKTLLEHDRKIFDNPGNWNIRSIHESPLYNSLKEIWLETLTDIYKSELSSLAYKAIPDSNEVLKNIQAIMDRIRSSGIE